MAPRKRDRDEMESSEPPKEMSLLEKIRNMWEFASTMQFIFMFGKVMKIDEDFDIEDFETECLKPGYSDTLEDVGLTLLKWISSHRGLNLEIWDEYTRRQYLAKAPSSNPYGDAEEPKKFRDFDVFQKIRVLHQLTVWTLWNPDRLRERMPDHQREVDQLEWRIEELGYDREDRQYYLLDDNRLYRRTEPPLPPLPKQKPKSNSLKALAARRRASKRRRIIESETPDEGSSMVADSEAEQNDADAATDSKSTDVDTFGGYKWECIAITLAQYQELCESFRKSKDVNEKTLRSRLINEVIPIIEAAEEKQRRKIERRERELLALEKLAGAKRSSRLADKHDRERQEQEAAAAERKRATDLAEAHRQQQMQEKMDRERQSRMMTREQRIKDREFKRILMEDELAKAAEDAKRLELGETRGSERHLKEKMERTKKEIEELSAEEEWTFDCSGCGVHGKNLDDGSHSVACEKCNVWQHSKCLGISKAAAEKDDFHFVCKDCLRPKEEPKKPKISLKFRTGLSSSPPQPFPKARVSQSPVASTTGGLQVPKKRGPGRPPKQSSSTNGFSLSHSSSPPHQPPSPYAPQPPRPNNSYLIYTAAPNQMVNPHQYPPYANGYAQPIPTRPPPLSASPPSQTSPHQQPNGYAPRPQQPGSPDQKFAPLSHQHRSNAGGAPSPHSQYLSYYNGIPLQYKTSSQASPTSPFQSAPRPPSVQHSPRPMVPAQARIPSPVLNRPNISPTQGNYDVGPVAGVPQKSSPGSYHPGLFTPGQPPSGTAHNINGVNSLQMTTPLSNIPNSNHLSGLSPTKHSPSLPASSVRSQKSSASPQPQQPNLAMRSFSGTPIFPPAEKLGPSREQLNKSPVPTPSKQMTPGQLGEAELKRVSEQIIAELNAER